MPLIATPDAAFAEAPHVRGADSDLLARAVEFMPPARTLLDHRGAMLLSVAAGSRGVVVAPWTDDLHVQPDLSSDCAAIGAARELHTVRRIGREICALVARRWPPNAVPRLVGIVTDGVGLAVSGGHPSALTRDWLIDHLTGRARISMILPFGSRAMKLVGRPCGAELRH